MIFGKCWEDANQKVKDCLEMAISLCFGNFSNEVRKNLLREEVDETKDPVNAYEYMRVMLQEFNYMSQSGFAAAFPRTDFFDRATISYRKKIGKSVSTTYYTNYDFDKASYTACFPQKFDKTDLNADNHLANEGYKKCRSSYRYYYRNELDHYLTHLLYLVRNDNKEGAYHDFGLEVLRCELGVIEWTPELENIYRKILEAGKQHKN